MSDWKQQFKRDAVRAALPAWELRDDDEITVEFQACDDYDYTYGGGGEWVSVYIEVSRSRSGERAEAYIDGKNAEPAAEFLTRLFE